MLVGTEPGGVPSPPRRWLAGAGSPDVENHTALNDVSNEPLNG